MKEKDLVRVKRIINEIFNKYDRISARHALEFHFKAKKVGIDDGRRLWVAESNNELVGFVGLVSTIQGIFWLSWYGVKKKYHGKGIGKALFEFVLDEAKKQKAKILCIEAGSAPMFKKANEMYKRYGFKEKFRIKDFWSKGDDLILFVKKFITKEKN